MQTNDQGTKIVVEGLGKLLANTYVLYLKTQNFHWNVTGPFFYSLHGLFEVQYQEFIAAIDEIAERIRGLGHVAPASFAQYAKLASIKESEHVPESKQMIKQLMEDQGAMIAIIKGILSQAESAHDQTTVDLLTRRLQVHEKNAWMLHSSLE